MPYTSKVISSMCIHRNLHSSVGHRNNDVVIFIVQATYYNLNLQQFHEDAQNERDVDETSSVDPMTSISRAARLIYTEIKRMQESSK